MSNYKKREYAIIAIILSIVIMVGILSYIFIYLPANEMYPHFQKIDITSVEANRILVITLNYANVGGIDANITNIFIDNKPLTSYMTFLDVYDTSGKSIKKLLNGRGYIIPCIYSVKDKELRTEKFTMFFDKDAFFSGQVINIVLQTTIWVNYNKTCRIP